MIFSNSKQLIFTLFLLVKGTILFSQIGFLDKSYLNFIQKEHDLNRLCTTLGKDGNFQMAKELLPIFQYPDIKFFMANSLFVQSIYGRDSSYQWLQQKNENDSLSLVNVYYIRSWLNTKNGDINDYELNKKQLVRLDSQGLNIFDLEAKEYIKYVTKNIHNEDDEKKVKLLKQVSTFLRDPSLTDYNSIYLEMMQIELNSGANWYHKKLEQDLSKIINLYYKYPSYFDLEKLKREVSDCSKPSCINLKSHIKKTELSSDLSNYDQAIIVVKNLKNKKVVSPWLENQFKNVYNQIESDYEQYKLKTALYALNNMNEMSSSKFYANILGEVKVTSSFASFIDNNYSLAQNKKLFSKVLEEYKLDGDSELESLLVTANNNEIYLGSGIMVITKLIENEINESSLMKMVNLTTPSLDYNQTHSWNEFGKYLLEQPLYRERYLMGYFGYPQIDSIYTATLALDVVNRIIDRYPGCYWLYELKQGVLVQGAEYYANKKIVYNELLDNVITLLDMCQSEGLGDEYNFLENLLDIHGEYFGADLGKVISDILSELDEESKLKHFQRLNRLVKQKPHQRNLAKLQFALVPAKYYSWKTRFDSEFKLWMTESLMDFDFSNYLEIDTSYVLSELKNKEARFRKNKEYRKLRHVGNAYFDLGEYKLGVDVLKMIIPTTKRYSSIGYEPCLSISKLVSCLNAESQIEGNEKLEKILLDLYQTNKRKDYCIIFYAIIQCANGNKSGAIETINKLSNKKTDLTLITRRLHLESLLAELHFDNLPTEMKSEVERVIKKIYY